MFCCVPREFFPEELEQIKKNNGGKYPVCPECGEDCDDEGEAIAQCGYGEVVCSKCNHRPCDGSC